MGTVLSGGLELSFQHSLVSYSKRVVRILVVCVFSILLCYAILYGGHVGGVGGKREVHVARYQLSLYYIVSM